MGTEIERKFLVVDPGWRSAARQSTPMRQGYLAVGPPVAVRVRVCGDTAVLNVKAATLAIARHEFEYNIPLQDGETLLAHFCQGVPIEKTRHDVEFGGLCWEVDEFHGANAGLVVAELELTAVDQPFAKPPWAGREVSQDPRYLNSSLALHPYSQWNAERGNAMRGAD